MKKEGATGNQAWYGISIDLWKAIARELNVDYEFRELDIEDLLSGLKPDDSGASKLDASVAALTVTQDRLRRIDFSHPFHPSGLAIAVPAKRTSGLWPTVMSLLSAQFLQGIGALCAVLLLTGGVVWWLERDKNEDFGGSAAEGLGNGFWWSAVTMTTVGYGDKAPKTPAGRAVALIWMFASIITISGFTAAIASSLTVSEISSRVRGPQDLAKVRVATVRDSFSEDWLRARGVATIAVATPSDAVQKLAEGGVGAVVHDAPLLKYTVNQRDDDSVFVLPVIFEPQEYAIALPRGSDLRIRINDALLGAIKDDAWQRVLETYLGN